MTLIAGKPAGKTREIISVCGQGILAQTMLHPQVIYELLEQFLILIWNVIRFRHFSPNTGNMRNCYSFPSEIHIIYSRSNTF
jgi:hypothetical protein